MNKHYNNAFDTALVKLAAERAYQAYDEHLEKIRKKGCELIKKARKNGMPIIILAGRP